MRAKRAGGLGAVVGAAIWAWLWVPPAAAAECAECVWERHDTAGHHHVADGELEAAEAAFAAALEATGTFANGDTRVIESLRDLALVRRRAGDDAGSIAYEERALEAIAEATERLGWDRMLANQTLAEIHVRLGNAERAEPHFRAALDQRRVLFGADDPEVAVALLELVNFYRDRGRFDEAIAAAREAVAIREKYAAEDDRPLAAALDVLSRLHVGAGRDEAAAAALARVLAIDERHLGPDHVFVAGVLEQYVPILRRLGRDEEADRLEFRAMDIRARSEAPLMERPPPPEE
jgi:tetratricopeptide (TPR) repeat protein